MRRLERPHGLVVLAAAAAAFFAIVVGQAHAALPDGRAYELVSPPDTNHNAVYGTRMTPGGDRVVVAYQGGVAGSSSGGFSLLAAQRSAGGWSSGSILPPADSLADTQYGVFATSPDLTRYIVEATHGYPFPQAPLKLLRIDADGTQTPLHTFDSSVITTLSLAVSDDLSHVLASVPEQIDPDHVAGTNNVYDFGSGTPVLVSRMPDGSVPACGVPAFGFQAFVVSSSAPSYQHVLSTDGRRAFFVSRGSTCSDPPELYMRDLQAGTTTLISGPVLSGTDGGATFLGASPDGSQAYYVSTSQIDPADGNTTRDIYRYTVGVGNECLTCGVPSANVSNANGSDFPVISPDGSRIYFTSNDPLTGDDTDGTKSAYLLENGTIRYIAPVDGLAYNPRQGGQTTPDGRVLLFRSSQPGLNAMTGSDNGGFFQYYRYDDGDHSLTCISCPSGAPATSDVVQQMTENTLFGADRASVMTNDGDTIVFKTRDALVSTDQNQDEDVYEWHDGAVGLLTDGVTTYTQFNGGTRTGSQVVGVSADGTNILFDSFSALTPNVIDTGQPTSQLYDARVGGGFPQSTPPAPCDGDQCHGAPSGPPSLADVGSATFNGSGNVAAPPVVRLTVSRVTAAQRTAFARHGRLTLRVGSNTAGALGASATARIGGRTRLVAHASKRVAAGGHATLVLRLSAAARRALAHGHGLRVTVTVHLAGTSASRRLTVALRPTATANGR